jgi:N6-L-threonylcarbamoyladenine synthase
VRDRVLDETLRADVARGVQEAIVECLCVKALRALEATDCAVLTVSGGVGANQYLRTTLSQLLASRGARAYYPRPEFCTDNAAMIAVAGLARLRAGQHDDLAIGARAQWALDSLPPLGNS